MQESGSIQQNGSHMGARLVSAREEASMRAPLAAASLRALGSLPQEAFREHLTALFPLLTQLITCMQSPPELQRALSEVFLARIGPLLSSPSS